MNSHLEEHLSLFYQETYELLQEIEYELLHMEENFNDKDMVDHIFRALHTIKGSSAMYSFHQISSFTHSIEEAFHLVREGQMFITADLVDLTLSACDQIVRMLSADAQEDTETCKSIIVHLEHLMPLRESEEPQMEPAADVPVSTSGELTIYSVIIHFALDICLDGTDPILLLNELRDLGKCTIVAQTGVLHHLVNKEGIEHINPEACYTYWEVLLETLEGEESIQEVFEFVEDKVKLDIQIQPSPSSSDSHYFETLSHTLLTRGFLVQNALHHVQASQRSLTSDDFPTSYDEAHGPASSAEEDSDAPPKASSRKNDHLSPFIRSMFSKNSAYSFQLEPDASLEALHSYLKEELEFQLKDFEKRWIRLQFIDWKSMEEDDKEKKNYHLIGQLIFRLEEINRFLRKNSGPPIIRYICSEVYDFLIWKKGKGSFISPSVMENVAIIFTVLNIYMAEEILELDVDAMNKMTDWIRNSVEELLTT